MKRDVPDLLQSPRRVGIVYHFFPHYRAAVLRELAKNGRHHYAFIGSLAPVDPTIRLWHDIKTLEHLDTPVVKLGGNWLFQRGTIAVAASARFDTMIYLASPYFVSTWLSAMVARASGKKVLFWTHGWAEPERGAKGMLRMLFFRIAHGLLLYGTRAREIGVSLGMDERRLHVVYNSLDYRAQRSFRIRYEGMDAAAVREEAGLPRHEPMIVCISRLTEECRFELLFEAMKKLRTQGHKVTALLVGSGPAEAELKRLAKRDGLPVSFWGECYDESTIARLTMAACATVSPGKIGLTAIQSLAFGIPVITHGDLASQGPEVEAITPGLTGELFKKGDADDLARVIRIWTSASQVSPAISRRCWEGVERTYTPEFQADKIEAAVDYVHDSGKRT